MSYTSFYVYQKYEQRGGQNPSPVYPNVYSVDGDGTMPLVIKMTNDPNCGYTPPVEPTYRWVDIDISVDYVCDNYNKYYKQKKQVSYDSGATWQNVVPTEYRVGSIYEYDSSDCGYLEIERWVTVSGDYMCSGTTKYTKERKEIIYDGGETWTATSDYRMGSTVIEYYSTDCGYVPPMNDKLRLKYSDSTTYTAPCDSSSELTTASTRPYGYNFSAITSAEIGSCVTSIGESAFTDCKSLSSITLPDTVTSIGRDAFYYCSGLTSIDFPDNLVTINNRAFNSCSGLTSIDFPDSLTTISQYAFAYCFKITSLYIPSGVTSIGNTSFTRVPFSAITVNANNTTYDSRNNCNAIIKTSTNELILGCKNAVIPNTVTSIGNSAFYNCSGLTSIVIPNSVTTIGDDAFGGCPQLTSVTIGSGLTSIGRYAFYYCNQVRSITCYATTPPTLGSLALSMLNRNCIIYVPASSVAAYQSASGWNEYSIQAIP